MQEPTPPSRSRWSAFRLSPYAVLPIGLAVLGLLAAPLYGNVMGSVMQMGDALRTMCGF